MTRHVTLECDVCKCDLTVSQRTGDDYFLSVASDFKRGADCSARDPVPRELNFCDWQCLGNYSRTQR